MWCRSTRSVDAVDDEYDEMKQPIDHPGLTAVRKTMPMAVAQRTYETCTSHMSLKSGIMANAMKLRVFACWWIPVLEGFRCVMVCAPSLQIIRPRQH